MLALLAWQAAGASMVRAEGAIRVVEANAQISASGEVNLTLTAQAEAEVTEVRVYYRPAGARVWAYSYADFDAGTRVTATQDLPPDGVAYFAPGVEVEYFYEISDARGNVLRTDIALIEYLDHRFDWRRTQVGPLTILYHDLSQSEVTRAMPGIEQDLARITGLLRLTAPQAIKGVLYNRSSDAQEAFPRESQTTTDQEVFAGFALAAQGVFVGLGFDRRIIAHESAHLLFDQALNERFMDTPSWLNEGFASYFEPEKRLTSPAKIYERSAPLRAMTAVSGTPYAIQLFYEKARSVVTYLIDEHGEQKFQRFMVALNNNVKIDDALESVYGFDIDGLEACWAGLDIAVVQEEAQASTQSLIAQSDTQPPAEQADTQPPAEQTDTQPPAGQADTQPLPEQADTQSPAAGDGRPEPQPRRFPDAPDSPSPFAFFDSWLFIAVALVVVTVVAVRAIGRRLRPSRAEEDPPYWDSYC